MDISGCVEPLFSAPMAVSCVGGGACSSQRARAVLKRPLCLALHRGILPKTQFNCVFDRLKSHCQKKPN